MNTIIGAIGLFFLFLCCWISFKAGGELELKSHLRTSEEEIRERYMKIYEKHVPIYTDMIK